MKDKGKERAPLRMIKPDHYLSLGTGLREMEQLDPKVASGMSPEVGWNYLPVPWMDEREELTMQRFV